MILDKMGNAIGYSTQERQEALCVSLCAVASSLGFTPVRTGTHYSLKEMDSLVIYNDRTWNRWSGKGNITGGTQIDFLMEFGGLDTPQQAIKWLLDFKGTPTDIKYARDSVADMSNERKERNHNMILPPKNGNYRRLFAYLIQTRGLSPDVVSYFVQHKLIYEDAVHHNIVYCGYDPQGNIRYAGLRGTADLYGKKLKMDVLGNDKNYGVNIVNPGNHTLLVFEAVIDCMSYIDMYKDYDSNKLILGMVEDTPLVQFLKDYNHIDTIHFCLDNDEAAHKALYGKKDESGNAISQGLVKKYEDQGFITDVIIPPSGKDFNEALLIQKKQQVETINNKTYGGR